MGSILGTGHICYFRRIKSVVIFISDTVQATSAVFRLEASKFFAPLRHRDLDAFLKRMALDKTFTAASTTKAEARIEQVKGSKPIFIATGCVDQIAGILGKDEDGFS